MFRSKHQSRVRTFTNFGSDDVELACDINPGARSIHTSEKQILGSENPFMGGEDTQEPDERASAMGVGSGWKGMNGVAGMGVQVDTEVEIQSDRWMGSRLELAQSRMVRCEGPDTQTGR
jgi:hypothetical protein